MPRPDQIAVVTANGQKYDIWTQIEVSRTTADPAIDHALLTVAEVSGLKLQPGDPATVTLAGQTVMKGRVYLRQGAVDANQHMVQIGIASRAQVVMASTVDGKPGQYINQTLQQIGSAVFGKVGVNFTVENVPGANLVFKRVSEHIGESRFAFVERLGRMRNIYLMDDGQGGFLGFRGPLPGEAVIEEGENLLRGRVVLRIDEHVSTIDVHGQDFWNDSADMNRATTGSTKVDPPTGVPFSILAEHTGVDAEMQLRANHQADWDKMMQVDGDVTVPGWFAPDGNLWFGKVRQIVTVRSQSMLPDDTRRFMIKGITHRQSNEGGTTTDLQLCREDGMGGGATPLQQRK